MFLSVSMRFCAVTAALTLFPMLPAAAESAPAFTHCRLLAQNQSLSLYLNEETASVCLYDHNADALWWSAPPDEQADTTVRSAVQISCGNPVNHAVSSYRSESDATYRMESAPDGVTIWYTFPKVSITLPVTYTLCPDSLEVSVDISRITEESDQYSLTAVNLLRGFAAADTQENGYFVIPDGCGALIRFNSGKTTAKPYDRMVYGDDLTCSAQNAPTSSTESLCLPVYGVVKEKQGGLLAVCTDGDANVRLCASVSGTGGSDYNMCGFSYMLRSADTYQLSGNAAELTAFQSGSIQTERIAVRYYPVADVAGSTAGVDYADIAAAYRDILQQEQGVYPAQFADGVPLYLDIYGAVEQERSFLGIPYTGTQTLTTVGQMQTMVETCTNAAPNMPIYMNIHQWSDHTISHKIEDTCQLSDRFGTKQEWQLLRESLEHTNGMLVPMVQNMAFRSGNGYYALWDAAVRITGAYAVRPVYDVVTGLPRKDMDAEYLLSPERFPTLADKLAQSGTHTIGLTDWASMLYGDYPKKPCTREQTRDFLQESLSKLDNAMDDGILSGFANAYALPYVDAVNNVPLRSSGYDLFDADVPFYQMVLHGLRSYATTPVNAAADSDAFVLRAVACGSSLHYDLMGADAAALRNTCFNDMTYASMDGWCSEAAERAAWVNTILSGVQGHNLRSYTEQGDVITAVYDNKTRIVTNLSRKTVTVNGKTYHLPAAHTNTKGA